jgi:hypothetical protein
MPPPLPLGAEFPKTVELVTVNPIPPAPTAIPPPPPPAVAIFPLNVLSRTVVLAFTPSPPPPSAWLASMCTRSNTVTPPVRTPPPSLSGTLPLRTVTSRSVSRPKPPLKITSKTRSMPAAVLAPAWMIVEAVPAPLMVMSWRMSRSPVALAPSFRPAMVRV